jgi:hypothetical protein
MHKNNLKSVHMAGQSVSPSLYYLSTIRGVEKRNELLNSRDAQYLEYFLEKPIVHGYEIYSSQLNLKPTTEPSFLLPPKENVYYQKVYRRLHNLQRLKYVKEVINMGNSSSNQKNRSRTKYYTLADGGIYYLIRNNRPLFLKFLKTLLENHGDNIIFQLLLYPYIERTTILQFKEAGLLSEISSYLYECSDATESAIDSISAIKSKIVTEEVFIWHGVPGSDEKRLFNFLENRFNIKWLMGAKIWKTGDGNTIRLRNKGNSLAISLDAKKMSANLIVNSKEIFQFVAESVGKENNKVVFIGAPVESIYQFAEAFLTARLKSLGLKFVINLLLRAIPSFPELVALSNDSTFRRQLAGAMEELQKRYKEVIQSSNPLSPA